MDTLGRAHGTSVALSRLKQEHALFDAVRPEIVDAACD